ncbi:MAG: glycosyltransferase [Rhodobacteraceae bacterium]|jgi:cellulose synthase/poly-beta-1,6-N-acetylglucosamine synthase-like glycosyltransferase|nr:glycosyltransferase [Paracoccaceae bacterium]
MAKASIRNEGHEPRGAALALKVAARALRSNLIPFPGRRATALLQPAAVPQTEGERLAAAARSHGATLVDPLSPLPDAALIDRVGLADCLRHRVVPLARAGSVTAVATARPQDFARLRPMLEDRLGPVIMTLAPAERIAEAILARRGPSIAARAEAHVPTAESCRSWGSENGRRWALFGACTAMALAVAAPLILLHILLALALVSLVAATLLKVAAAIAALRAPDPEPEAPAKALMPRISIIVALYREDDIAARLVARLSRLEYPRDLLDVILAVEIGDRMTRDALTRADLPPWMRVVVVPEGRVKTKPRALNVALGQCRGSIIGIYDAEDAPEPAQLRKVVERFQRRGPEVACLQGALDYYNPRTNWLSRCFTIEYATWFRLILPGIARLGLAVPLGGTTLFFRRDVIEALGGWDAHNVTEDADLGIRLVRHGYRTELIGTVTMEEANCRILPWVKQRSRWIKGYMMTWFVHMRDPVLLWRQIGPRAFLGFQVMFAGSILQALLAPLLWSFWIVSFGLPHPVAGVLPTPALQTMAGLFLASATIDAITAAVGLRRSGHRLSPLWALTLHGYFPFASFAAYKALWELITRPFYWDKTTHGIFDPAGPG